MESSIMSFWKEKYLEDTSGKEITDKKKYVSEMLLAFTPGLSYFYEVNFQTLKISYISESVFQFLGKRPEEVAFKDIISTACKDQISSIELKERVIYDFFFEYLLSHERTKYKIIYLYKMKDHTGKTRTILHQAIILNIDELGNLKDVLSIHTDITYLNLEPSNAISFIKLDGSSSFLNLDTTRGKFNPHNSFDSDISKVLTKREKEIVQYLSKGDSSKEIASKLYLSVHTVQKHRKNILSKTECKNTSEVVHKYMMSGNYLH